jgi:hypothetical protein
MISRGPATHSRFTLLIAASCVLLAAAVAPGSALAIQVTQHHLSSSFDGTGSTAGPFSSYAISSIAVNESTNDVFVLDEAHQVIDQFDQSGKPVAFSGPALSGTTSLSTAGFSGGGSQGQLAIDNSSNVTEGRIYFANEGGGGGSFAAYDPDGEPAIGYPFEEVNVTGVAVDPLSSTFWISGNLSHYVEQTLSQYSPAGEATGLITHVPQLWGVRSLAIDSAGNLYATDYRGQVGKYGPTGAFQYLLDPNETVSVAVDPVTDFVYLLERINGAAQVKEYNSGGVNITAWPVGTYASTIAVNGANGKVYVGGNENVVEIYSPDTTLTLPTPLTKPASNFTTLGAQLNGAIVPEGVATTECKFEWGSDATYGHTVPCAQGNVLTGEGAEEVQVSAVVSGLSKGTTYHYRVVAANANGTLRGRDTTFVASEPPTVSGEFASDVHADSVDLHATVNAEGAETRVHFEYGTVECNAQPGACSDSPDISAGSDVEGVALAQEVNGLEQGTTYHYRAVATNQNETVVGSERTFTTFPITGSVTDACSNAHVRQQTGSALLLDCRAYELASAASTGGYDVESSLVAGESPFGGYPEATGPSRLLYGVHDGGIPGSNHPTNRGVDPYVATRGATGWSTEYVGTPANNPFAASPFSSTPSGASASLDTFAFGGAEGCSPCFAGGYTGVPVRLSSGEIVQGMVPAPGVPAPPSSAAADGFVAKDLSANGAHFIFGSATKFVEGGAEDGDVSIYDRDLVSKETHLVSTDASGQALSCLQGAGKCNSAEGDADGISELDVSADGSHILVGQKVSTDSDGNVFWHLYLNVGDASASVSLTPGASQGVLFDGMTEDGSKVFFSSNEHLIGEDTEHSGLAIYMWSQKGEEEGHPLELVSRGDNTGASGEPGNASSCAPDHDWNTVAAVPDCSAVAIGGGGGVASGDGTLYFLSPELLDGSSAGIEGEPNLYVARPGSPPAFVATIDTGEGKVPPPPNHPSVRTIGNVQKPSFVTVDRSGGASAGDIYIADAATNTIQKFDSAGTPITSWASAGTLNTGYEIAGIAVGEAGTLEVLDSSGERLVEYTETGAQSKVVFVSSIGKNGLALDSEGYFYKVFPGAQPYVAKYSSTGQELGAVSLRGGVEPVGMAVDPTNDVLYVLGVHGSIQRFVFGASPNQVVEPGQEACTLSSNGCKATSLIAEGLTGVSAIAVDPDGKYMYVDQRNKISQFELSGNQLQTSWTGAGITKSTSIAVGPNGHIYATSTGATHGEVVEYGVQPAAFSPIDDPTVVNAVQQSATRFTSDFQVSPNGDFAVFPTRLSLSGDDNARHTELFRYDAPDEESICVSCPPTGARATGNASLASDGLSLTDDGRVFFNSTDPIAPRDLDELQDAYEWEPLGAGPEGGRCEESSLSFGSVSGGCLELVSTGTSSASSALLGISADGTDAYFFTREKLVPQDENGNLVKVYDARQGGGFPYLEPEISCKASDECHGAGSAAPGPTGINTIKGSGGNAASPKHCKKGYTAKSGRCVKRHKSRRHPHHRRRAHRHAGGSK